MKTLAELIAHHSLNRALIVDDAYDIVPRASDLATEAGDWATFFTDLTPDDTALLEKSFHGYQETDATRLMNDDAFVATVWGLRETLRPELVNPVFERYRRTYNDDMAYLERLEEALKQLNIESVRGTRQVPDANRTEPIIFADLYLGSEQTDADMSTSVDRLKRLLHGRALSPPLVILMSRSPRLSSKKADFRNRTGVLGSMFRVHTKEALLSGDTLPRTLERLARHRDDALKVATFIETWRAGLDGASQRFVATMRRLDLADYGQIQELLLEFEGQPLGSYLLDIFDRVLEHEIEHSSETILAAEALNAIDTRNYPAPYIAGSPDLQELLSRVIYQHTERLKVRNTRTDAPVSFGDVLARRKLCKEELAERRAAKALAKKLKAESAAADSLPLRAATSSMISPDGYGDAIAVGHEAATVSADSAVVSASAAHDVSAEAPDSQAGVSPSEPQVDTVEKEEDIEVPTDDVLLVLTPACDLVRGGAKRVLMMAGALEELTPESWAYKTAGVRTPIVTFLDGRRMWIKWDPKDLQTLAPRELQTMLGTGGTHARLVRLRESYALELQQQLLSNLGRVGLVAQMPASFAVDVELWSIGIDGKLRQLPTPLLGEEGGVCLAGRDSKAASVSVLRLSEEACDEIVDIVTRIKDVDVQSSSRETLARAKERWFSQALEHGLQVPGEKGGWAPLNVFAGKFDSKDKQVNEPVGLVGRNPPSMDYLPKSSRHAGVVLILRDRIGV